MDFGIYAGDTSKTIYLGLRDSTTGLAKTGLVFNSAGAVASYTLPLAARAAITLATQTVDGAWATGGFVEVDATNCKGLYRLDVPDAAIASGAYTIISIEFDGTMEESVLLPLHVRKVNATELNGDSTASANLAVGAKALVYNTAKAGTLSTTQMSTNLTEATDDHYIGRTVVWTTGVLLGQASDVTDYVGVNGVLTFSALTEAPGVGDQFILV
jgi:hypothetical protein